MLALPSLISRTKKSRESRGEIPTNQSWSLQLNKEINMKIGFIGLGIMGSRMAANLEKHGYALALFDRTPAKAERLIGPCTTLVDSPAYQTAAWLSSVDTAGVSSVDIAVVAPLRVTPS